MLLVFESKISKSNIFIESEEYNLILKLKEK